jgi:hypothetical protein
VPPVTASTETTTSPRRVADLPWGLFAALACVTLLTPVSSVFSGTLATGGDVGAHVWYPDALRSALPFLHTYSNDWFSGVPVGYFYFPVPALLTNLFSLVVGYNAGFKMVLVLGLFLLPVATWRLASVFGANRLQTTLAAFAGVGLLQEQFFTIFGGNTASNAAGMYSYQIALALSLLAAAEFVVVLRTGRRRFVAAVFFAAALCSHVLAGVIAPVLVGAVLLFAAPVRAWKARALAALSALAGGLIAAAWWLPFLLSRGSTVDMGYEAIKSWRWVLPITASYPDGSAHNWHWWGIAALALASLAHLRSGYVRVLLTLAGVSQLLYWFAPRSAVWNVRWLPTYYLAAWLLAAFVLSQLVPPRRSTARTIASVVAVLLVFAPIASSTKFPYGGYPNKAAHPHRGWMSWDLDGYQNAAKWQEYRSAMQAFGELAAREGCGRMAWEYDAKQGEYGTPLAMFLMPFFTDGCVASLEGLYYEASSTTPFHFGATPWYTKTPSRPVRNLPYPGDIDMDRAMEALDALGADWYATFNEDTAKAALDAGLKKLTTTGPWTVWEVPNGGVVSPLQQLPLSKPWNPDTYVAHFLTEPAEHWTEWDSTNTKLPDELPKVTVSNVTTADGEVRFSVSRPGVPVIVHMSYFDGWRVSNGELLGRAGPNMLLVLPTENDVRVHWERPASTHVAYVIAVIGLLCALALSRLPRYATAFNRPEQESDAPNDDACDPVEELTVTQLPTAPRRDATHNDVTSEAQNNLATPVDAPVDETVLYTSSNEPPTEQQRSQ